MRNMMIKTTLLFGLFCVTISGCSKHDVEPEISLEDMAKVFIEQSRDGTGVYGGNLTRSDTLKVYFPELSADSIRWVADWHLRPHSYQIDFDTVTDRGVPGLRAAKMSIRDTFAVTITLLIDADSVIEKTNYATAWSKATLVQLGHYGQPYHGWVMRRMAHRLFRTAAVFPSVASVTVEYGTRSKILSTAEFSVDDVDSLARGDSVTVWVRTTDPTDLFFLNVTDGGSVRRIPMEYVASRTEFTAGWRVSTAAVSKIYYQAFVEAYDRTVLRATDSTAVGVVGQTFAYRVK